MRREHPGEGAGSGIGRATGGQGAGVGTGGQGGGGSQLELRGESPGASSRATQQMEVIICVHK